MINRVTQSDSQSKDCNRLHGKHFNWTLTIKRFEQGSDNLIFDPELPWAQDTGGKSTGKKKYIGRCALLLQPANHQYWRLFLIYESSNYLSFSPSFLIPFLKHFFSRQCWHWFLRWGKVSIFPSLKYWTVQYFGTSIFGTLPMMLIDRTVATSSALVAQASANRPLEKALATWKEPI